MSDNGSCLSTDGLGQGLQEIARVWELDIIRQTEQMNERERDRSNNSGQVDCTIPSVECHLRVYFTHLSSEFDGCYQREIDETFQLTIDELAYLTGCLQRTMELCGDDGEQIVLFDGKLGIPPMTIHDLMERICIAFYVLVIMMVFGFWSLSNQIIVTQLAYFLTTAATRRRYGLVNVILDVKCPLGEFPRRHYELPISSGCLVIKEYMDVTTIIKKLPQRSSANFF